MHTVSIEVENSSDLQLLVLLIKRLGLKIVNQTAVKSNEDKQLKHHLEIIASGGTMTEQRMEEMLNWIEEDRNDDSRSSRPE